jgi:hypothetical protein
VLYAKDFSFFCAAFSFFWLTIYVIFAVFLWFSFANRLTNIKENHKFQKDGKEVHGVEDPTLGLRHIVGEIKDKHALKYDSLIYIFISFAATLFYKIFMIFIFGIARYVYVLHAITGY